jgi:hypothetical protein
MLHKFAIATGLALAVALPAHAEFRWELGAGYLSGDVEGDEIDADIDVANINGSWFFSSVNTEKGPLSEAAFLDRASRVDVLFEDGELDGDAGDADISSYGVGSRWVFDKDAGWFVEGAYTYSEVEDFETDTFSIGGGKYVFENTLVALSYSYSDPDLGDDIDTYAVEVEHLQELPFGALKLEGAYAYADPGDSSDTDNWLGTVIYYPLNQLGVGGSWQRTISGSSSDTWAVFAEWFVTENIALSLEYQDTEDAAGINNVDGDAFVGSALIRF